ncbi:hypothetical protein BV22DRAFT_1102387 [Leucogyrophana mollusca]|uniref:Uncharacterized protein n=1 Tax=Leucogyrophana mollusca TaxID=85980 RepID=A0ACB8BVB6_9AGAM|nr:hypothetical protein BV22DRAFT_1102387 [Leucogyrophana mollusca]
MSFRSRNAYYLRISATTVLPLYLYLDDRHTDWMSDIILQRVLEDLRPLVLPKWQAERDIHVGSGASANGKKGSVDVHRGDCYQLAYFFRETEPHSVIIKTRYFAAAPPPSKSVAPPEPEQKARSRSGKRKSRSTAKNPANNTNQRKKRKTKGKGRARSDSNEEEEEPLLTDEDSAEEGDHSQDTVRVTRRSRRSTRVTAGGYREDDDQDADIEISARQIGAGDSDVEMEPSLPDAPASANDPGQSLPTSKVNFDILHTPKHFANSAKVKEEEIDAPLATENSTSGVSPAMRRPDPPPDTPDIELVVEEEEKKPKPLLQLSYQGFNIFGHCLCVVVEPWPPMRSGTRALSAVPVTITDASRGSSIAPPEFVANHEKTTMQRGRTPLFLPEFDRERSETPAPFPRAKVRPPVPLFDDPEPTASDEDDGYTSDDLLSFSQSLRATGDLHTITADDDDEMDGAVMFGDADEVREFS